MPIAKPEIYDLYICIEWVAQKRRENNQSEASNDAEVDETRSRT